MLRIDNGYYPLILMLYWPIFVTVSLQSECNFFLSCTNNFLVFDKCTGFLLKWITEKLTSVWLCMCAMTTHCLHVAYFIICLFFIV